MTREARLMCGIIGIVGRRSAEPVLLEGLRRMEYRGYDSAGVATLAGPELQAGAFLRRVCIEHLHTGRSRTESTIGHRGIATSED